MSDWTMDQKKVITSHAARLVCSAAAGSGKTAVLVERMIRMISDGEDPESFLIITFTNAAASEMKEKIRDRLSRERQNPRCLSALEKMDLCTISTIHAFCQQLLRNQFQALDLDPMFQICDVSRQNLYFHEAFLDACNGAKKENDPEYGRLRQYYDVRSAEKLIRQVHIFMESLPYPERWLEKAVENIPVRYDPEHPWFKMLIFLSKEKLKQAGSLLERMRNMLEDREAVASYRDTWEKDAELFHMKQSWADHPEGKVPASTFSTLKTPRNLNSLELDWKDRYQDLRKKYRDTIREADELFAADPEKTCSEWDAMKDQLKALFSLTLRTRNLYRQKKKDRALLDFSDLEQEALRLLQDRNMLEEVRQTWRHIFVDECQDVSEVQNEIIEKLSGPENDLFMVGDVKQSIYRFRLANPLLFLNRIREWSASPDSVRDCIYLQSNFRSRWEILETTNWIFRKIMKEDVTELDYTPRDELVPGRKTEEYHPVCVDLIEKNEEQPELEAIADHLKIRMEELREQPCPGTDRLFSWKDMVILMPAVSGTGAKLSALLQEREIPVFFDGGSSYYLLPEILHVHALLEWVMNPFQDLPLLSVLKHPPFLFSDQMLAEIRLFRTGKNVPFHEAFSACAKEESPLGKRCARVMEKYGEWKLRADSWRIADFIWYLYQDSGLYDAYAARDDGALCQANLRLLADQAVEEESRGVFTLQDFLKTIRDRQSGGDQRSAAAMGKTDNMVRIMTVHKSKGLQFPAVFCVGIDRFGEARDAAGIRLHPKLGACLPYKDPAHRISRPTLADRLFREQKEREERAEKVRLLYVAMTRAQERLFLVSCKTEDPLWTMPECAQRIQGAKGYVDWVMPPLLDEKLSTGYTQGLIPWNIRVFDSNQQKYVKKSKIIHNLKTWLDSVLSAPVVNDLWKKDSMRDADTVLRKRSVTSLIREARQNTEDQEEETPEGKRIPDTLARKLSQEEIPQYPSFLRENREGTAVWRGTLIHRFLSLTELEKLRKAREEEVEDVLRDEKTRMLSAGIFTPEEAQKIPVRQLKEFYLSDLGKRMLGADEIRREWNFNLLIERENRMILQGVIDCAFREGDRWVILDYKTDRVEDEDVFREEYRPQLSWYARALAELTGQPVAEQYLYAISVGKSYRLK